jgi:hypothetical protein
VTILIDACLSTRLALRARERGHADATHLRWIGKADWKDHSLRDVIVEGGYLFVTLNSVDFRGRSDPPGSAGIHAGIELHAGLICLNAPGGIDLNLQLELFDVALSELEENPDLYNMALEVTLAADSDSIIVQRYPIPRQGPYARSSAEESERTASAGDDTEADGQSER